MSENTNYLVFARKYRPQSFDSVVGQEHVAQTLRNAIELKRVGHAYLFCGPRGVGKTSMARIFAKALNCEKGPTPTPCGRCQACVQIESARMLDVLEIDGASNRGIDEVRALRENVKFAPATAAYKVYIIDEVHQITSDAFNALLKTLEEPPAHVKFIFATTEAHKVPATILSRCQRFDFKRIGIEKITQSLAEICKKEKVKIEAEALFVIAKAADGSLRDGQSILDQIVAASSGPITKKDVVSVLGLLEEEAVYEIFSAAKQSDLKKAMNLCDSILVSGKDEALFLEKMLEHTRHLLFLKRSVELKDLVETSEPFKEQLIKQSAEFSSEDLYYFYSVLSSTLMNLKRYEIKRIPVEVAIVRMCSLEGVESIPSLIQDIKALRDELKRAPRSTQLGTNTPASKAAQGSVSLPPIKSEMAPDVPARSHAPKHGASDNEDIHVEDYQEISVEEIRSEAQTHPARSLDSVWLTWIREVKKEKISVGTYLEEGQPHGLFGNVAKVYFLKEHSFHKEALESSDNKRLLEKHLGQILGLSIRVEFESVEAFSAKAYDEAAEDAPPAAAEQVSETQAGQAVNDEALKDAMNIFGGKMIRNTPNA